MNEYINSESVFEALGEKLCSHCSWNINSINIDCPVGLDIYDKGCKNHRIFCDVASIVDRANEEIGEIL